MEKAKIVEKNQEKLKCSSEKVSRALKEQNSNFLIRPIKKFPIELFMVLDNIKYFSNEKYNFYVNMWIQMAFGWKVAKRFLNRPQSLNSGWEELKKLQSELNERIDLALFFTLYIALSLIGSQGHSNSTIEKIFQNPMKIQLDREMGRDRFVSISLPIYVKVGSFPGFKRKWDLSAKRLPWGDLLFDRAHVPPTSLETAKPSQGNKQ